MLVIMFVVVLNVRITWPRVMCNIHGFLSSVVVGNAPVIMSPLHDSLATAGKITTLECDISVGQPAATLRW